MSSKRGDQDEKSPDRLLARAYGLESEEQAKELYAEWASSYDETMLDGLAYLTPKRTAGLLAGHLTERAAPILDVGAGTGLAGVELSALGYKTIDALDYSEAMLEVAGGRGIYRALIEADLNKPLAIADGAYRAIICTGTFTHSHVGAGCLDELVRITEPAGLIACTIHNEVWQPMGFADKAAALIASRVVDELECVEDIYFETDTEPQGRYLVWRIR